MPLASNLNFSAGQTVPNAVLAKLGAAGSVCLYVSAGTHLIADVNAWFPVAGAGALTPARLLDSRPGYATVDGLSAGIGRRPAGSVTELVVAGRGAVPIEADAVGLNVTVTGAGGAGYVTVFPCGTTMPLASNLNFSAGQTVPNAVLAKVGASGKVCLYVSAATHVIADVNAWFGSLEG